MFVQVAEMDKEVAKVLEKSGAQYPPTQEMMKSVFGNAKLDFSVLKKEGVAAYVSTLTPLQDKEFDVTNTPEACVQCCCHVVSLAARR
jgi:hypothetical protein